MHVLLQLIFLLIAVAVGRNQLENAKPALHR
jgi:hypothetical protein